MRSLKERLDEISEHAASHNERMRKIEERASGADWVSSLVFVAMAQTEQFDDVTITEHSALFPEWDPLWTGKRGAILMDEGVLYRALHDIGPGQNTKPTEDNGSLWKKIGNPGEEWPEWSQPIGTLDAYAIGDKVTHNGKRWICTGVGGDGKWNVWEPGVYGWTEQP